nr:MAG TPA: hypothetical protein [Bacteriophage sp.]
MVYCLIYRLTHIKVPCLTSTPRFRICNTTISSISKSRKS